MTTRVLAIDPGYERLGVAVIEKQKNREQLLFSTCVITPRTLPFSERLLMLGETVKKLIKEYQPTLVAIEKLFFTTNQKTASAVSEVRGMLLYLAALYHLPTTEFTPLQIKNTITGYGKASKDQVTAMVRQLVEIKTTPKHDDEYDAIAIGLTALAREKW